MELKELHNIYKKWVINHPNIVTDVETPLTWFSYFLAGKINKSPVVSELVYTLSRLLSLYNDRLIKDANDNQVTYNGLREQLKLWMTIVHYSEVFVELLASERCASRGKWTIATILQMFQCASALILLLRYKEVAIGHPPIPPLDRKKYATVDDTEQNSSFKLRRSGRVMRTVDGAPPAAFRDWQGVKINDNSTNATTAVKDLLFAELLHSLKPLIHLYAMRTLGTKTWAQWFVALGLDLTSLRLYNRHMKNLSYIQRLEVSRRKLGLVLYLLRSPMYNGFSRYVIEGVLNSLSKNVPMMSYVCGPLTQYLNYWQNIYFYMWSS